jgi:hypothetical protein
MEKINTKKVIERITREFEKKNSAQRLIDTCDTDLLEHFYWEYKETKWEYDCFLTQIVNYVASVKEKLIKILKDINLKNDYIRFLEARRNEELKIWGESLINTAELMEDITREEMLLNIKEQGYE